MSPRLQCTNPRCAEKFLPSPQQRQFIKASAAKGMSFIMLECPGCGMHLPFNPRSPTGALVKKARGPMLRCPTRRCSGWVCKVERFWGCGECGETWPSRKALDLAISRTVRGGGLKTPRSP